MKHFVLFIFILLAVFSTSCKKELCDDTCYWPSDGECDDGGENSITDYCPYGTDCADCGTRKER